MVCVAVRRVPGRDGRFDSGRAAADAGRTHTHTTQHLHTTSTTVEALAFRNPYPPPHTLSLSRTLSHTLITATIPPNTQSKSKPERWIENVSCTLVPCSHSHTYIHSTQHTHSHSLSFVAQLRIVWFTLTHETLDLSIELTFASSSAIG